MWYDPRVSVIPWLVIASLVSWALFWVVNLFAPLSLALIVMFTSWAAVMLYSAAFTSRPR